MSARALACVLLLAGCAAHPDFAAQRPAQPPSRAAERRALAMPPPAAGLEQLESLPLLRLRGGPYERGYQYGQAQATAWAEAVVRLEAAAAREVTRYVGFEAVATWLYHSYTDAVFEDVFDPGSEARAQANLPPEDRAYLQGLADGAGLELHKVTRLVATVMISDASCSGFIAFGPATEDGRLLQLRNLDWGDDILQPQRASLLILHEPEEGARFLSIGFVGLVGSVSGINEHGISLTEVGADSADKTRSGRPMPLLLDAVLREAQSLDEALAILRAAPGTGGYNFLVGSARERRGAVVEKNASRTAIFEVGATCYRDNPDFYDVPGFDARADAAADPAIRAQQRCSGGEPGRVPSPSPASSGAWRKRYHPQVCFINRRGPLTVELAAELAALVAPADNLHSILYDFSRGKVYIRNKAWLPEGVEGGPDARAAVQPPLVLELDELFPARLASH